MTFDEFQKIDLRVGTVKSAERIAGSEKLVKLGVELGEEAPRQMVAGIGKAYTPEELVGRQIAVVANLEPRSLMGEESLGMILAAHRKDGSPVILIPEKEVPNGAKIT